MLGWPRHPLGRVRPSGWQLTKRRGPPPVRETANKKKTTMQAFSHGFRFAGAARMSDKAEAAEGGMDAVASSTRRMRPGEAHVPLRFDSAETLLIRLDRRSCRVRRQ